MWKIVRNVYLFAVFLILRNEIKDRIKMETYKFEGLFAE